MYQEVGFQIRHSWHHHIGFALDIVMSCLFCWRDYDHLIHSKCEPLMISMHQLISLGNFGTFSNFSLFFPPWNIGFTQNSKKYRSTISTSLYNTLPPTRLNLSPTWLKVFTNSKDFKWFRRSPLLHNSYKTRCAHFEEEKSYFSKGWLVIAKLKPLSLFISLFQHYQMLS